MLPIEGTIFLADLPFPVGHVVRDPWPQETRGRISGLGG
jgi:hypothetical protein